MAPARSPSGEPSDSLWQAVVMEKVYSSASGDAKLCHFLVNADGSVGSVTVCSYFPGFDIVGCAKSEYASSLWSDAPFALSELSS
jgi:hypothetical protein